MPRSSFLIGLTLPFLLVGCGAPADKTVDGAGQKLPVPQSTDDWKTVEGIEYKSWKECPIGTTVKHKSATTNGMTTTTSVETWTLRSVNSQEVEVENQNTTTRSETGRSVVNPPRTFKYQANWKVHPELDPAGFLKPDPKAKEIGEEKLTILGRDYLCKKFEWSNSTESGEMKVTAWVNDDIPGRVARQTMVVEKLKITTTDEIIELTKPDVKK